MKCRAVVFDLFGTLIDNLSRSEHKHVLSNMANILGVPSDAFQAAWFDTFDLRCTGEISSVEENIRYVCNDLNFEPCRANIGTAVKIRYEYTKKALEPKSGAIQVLHEIRKLGLSLGLISDCSSEVPKLWGSTLFFPLFDICIFSCMVGMKKPNVEIYHLASDKLHIAPEHCFYVGDGSSNELSGARNAGMYPIMIQDPDEFDAHRIDEENWSGDTISKLDELLRFFT